MRFLSKEKPVYSVKVEGCLPVELRSTSVGNAARQAFRFLIRSGHLRRQPFSDRETGGWVGTDVKLLKQALASILLCLCAVPALANRQQTTEAKPCACGVVCGCAPLACRCPKLVTFQDGTKAVFVPGPVDTKPGWPFMGPFRWIGATGRWTVGAPPRFVR